MGNEISTEAILSAHTDCNQMQYQRKWSAVFNGIRTYIKTLLPKQPNTGSIVIRCLCTTKSSPNGACGRCHDFLMAWVFKLEKVLQFADLETKIGNSLEPVPAAAGLTKGSPHLPRVAKYSQNLIENIPPFVSPPGSNKPKRYYPRYL